MRERHAVYEAPLDPPDDTRAGAKPLRHVEGECPLSRCGYPCYRCMRSRETGDALLDPMTPPERVRW